MSLRAAPLLAIALAALLALGTTDSRAGELVEVDHCTVDGIASKPAPSAEAALNECTRLIGSRRYAGAELASLYLQRGHIYLAMRQAKPAIADFSRAIELKPDLIDAYRGRAEAHFLNREIERAAEDYTRAIALAPKDAWLLYARAVLYYHAGDCKRAIDDYSAAIQLAPLTAQFYAQRALCYAMAGDHLRELLDHVRAAHFEPDSFAHASSVCRVTLRVRSAEETIAKCSNVIARWPPRSAAALAMRGLAHVKLGKHGEAIADFDAALALSPKEPLALFGRGVAKLRSGDAAGGQADMAAAKAVAPHIADAVGVYGIRP